MYIFLDYSIFKKKKNVTNCVSQATVAALLTERAQLTYLRNDPNDPFSATDSFRLNHNPTWDRQLNYLEQQLNVKWSERSNGVFTVSHDGKATEISAVLIKAPTGETFLKSYIDGQITKCRVERVDGEIYIFTKVLFQIYCQR